MIWVILWILYGILGCWMVMKLEPHSDGVELWFLLEIIVLSPFVTSLVIGMMITKYFKDIKVSIENGHLTFKKRA